MNSYITKSLDEGETIVLLGHYHWTFVAWQTIVKYLLLLVSVAAVVARHFCPGQEHALGIVAWVSLGLGLVVALWGYILRSRTEFAVTDTRFIQKDGVLDIEIKEIPLYKVETVNFSQSLLQRILGTGSIELVGSGGTTHRLTYIAHPMEVKRAIARAINNKEKMQQAQGKSEAVAIED